MGKSRWRSPSPDSDYDCRFLYVRPQADYLDPWAPRDVIETPLDGLLDANGWDLVKAVRLGVRGNATVGEWLRSPFVYAGEPAFRDQLLDLLDATADRGALVRHYLHVGRDHWRRSGAADGEAVALKRVFYAVRPAATLRWLAAYPDRVTPPMSLGELLADIPPPRPVADCLAALLAAKAATRELGTGVVAAPLVAWVEDAFAVPEPPPAPDDAVRRARAVAADAFRELLATWAPR